MNYNQQPLEGGLQWFDSNNDDGFLSGLWGSLKKFASELGELTKEGIKHLPDLAPLAVAALSPRNDTYLFYHPQQNDFEVAHLPTIDIDDDEIPTVEDIRRRTEAVLTPPSEQVMLLLKAFKKETNLPIRTTIVPMRPNGQRVQAMVDAGQESGKFLWNKPLSLPQNRVEETYTPPVPQNPLAGLIRQNMGQIAPPQYHSQASNTEVFETPRQSNEALLRALDPNYGRSSYAPIQEDWGQIQHNLAHAQKPKTQAEIHAIRQQQELVRQQAEIEALQEQMRQDNYRRQYQRQIRAGSRIPGYSNQEIPRQPLDILHQVPDAYLNQSHGKPINLTDKLRRGEPLGSLDEWKQFAHTMHLKYYDLVHQGQQARADFMQNELEDAVVSVSTGPNALKTKDGYVVIGNRAYGTAESHQKAREFVDYLIENDQFPPAKYPSNPNLPQKTYPNITEKVNKLLDGIVIITKQESQKGFLNGTKPLFERMFDNNQPWDLQVNHELPGQVLKDEKVQYDLEGKVITTDQYAIFRGKIHRAGYISNFTFGYASAAAGLSLSFMFTLVQVKALLGGNDGDNPQDLIAMKEGWNTYWIDYSDK